MSFTMITERHNYDDGYISLVNVNLKNLPDVIEFDNLKLLRKSEFHVSLVCLKQLDDTLETDKLDVIKTEIKNVFLEYEKQHDLTNFALLNEYRLVKRGDRVTVIAMVDMPSIDGLFDAIRAKTKLNIPTQVMHSTIYTLQPDRGIGVTSLEQLKSDSWKINLPALSELRVAS